MDGIDGYQLSDPDPQPAHHCYPSSTPVGGGNALFQMDANRLATEKQKLRCGQQVRASALLQCCWRSRTGAALIEKGMASCCECSAAPHVHFPTSTSSTNSAGDP
ncbi:hypothetical protein SRHO_G00103960 [Serrasalmus rhombeus]